MSLHDHLIFPQLLCAIPRTRTRDLDPHLGEESTGREDEDEQEEKEEEEVRDRRLELAK